MEESDASLYTWSFCSSESHRTTWLIFQLAICLNWDKPLDHPLSRYQPSAWYRCQFLRLLRLHMNMTNITYNITIWWWTKAHKLGYGARKRWWTIYHIHLVHWVCTSKWAIRAWDAGFAQPLKEPGCVGIRIYPSNPITKNREVWQHLDHSRS